MNVFAALALTFKLAQTDQFRNLQQQIVKNCSVLNDRLQERGFRIPFGGTDTHLTNIDTKSVTGPDGTPLSGDQAARLLDLAGIVPTATRSQGTEAPVIRVASGWGPLGSPNVVSDLRRSNA